MRLRHILGETWTGLRRNMSMTVAILVTMWVSLTLFGGGLLAAQQIETMKGRWYDQIEISVFLCTADTYGPNCTPGQHVTDQEKTAIEDALKANPEVQEIYYESQQDAYQAFLEDYGDSPVRDALTVDQMQEAYRIALVNPEQYQSVIDTVTEMSGVQNVQDLRQYFDALFSWLRAAQWAAIGTSVLLLLAAALQIGNTIKLAVFARRREISIMRLVGASNSFITLPFVLQTLVAGVAGAVLACATLGFGVWALILRNAEVSIQTLPWIGWEEAGLAMGGVAIVAVLLSIIPTLIATRRYVRV